MELGPTQGSDLEDHFDVVELDLEEANANIFRDMDSESQSFETFR